MRLRWLVPATWMVLAACVEPPPTPEEIIGEQPFPPAPVVSSVSPDRGPAAGGTATGTVEFRDGAATLGSAVFVVNHTLPVETSPSPGGVYVTGNASSSPGASVNVVPARNSCRSETSVHGAPQTTPASSHSARRTGPT